MAASIDYDEIVVGRDFFDELRDSSGLRLNFLTEFWTRHWQHNFEAAVMRGDDSFKEVDVEIVHLRNQVGQCGLRLKLEEHAHIAELHVGIDEENLDSLF